METAIRRQKDTAILARASGDQVLRRKCQGSIAELNRHYAQLADRAGLKPEYTRTNVAGFRDVRIPSGNLTASRNDGTIKERNAASVRINSPIEQRNTGKGNPNAILHFGISLNNRQRILLDLLPAYDCKTVVRKHDVNMRDLSALTAKTGVEYAMFTRKGERLIVRGNVSQTNIDVEAAKKMAAEGWKWSGHTHPGTDVNTKIASNGDYAILKAFGQKQSAIYDSLGAYDTFGGDSDE